jgi:chromosome segregation ATPase
LSELQQKHDELFAKNRDLESSHASQVDSLQAELKSTLERHSAEIASHIESRELQLSELQNQSEQTKAKLQAELEALQASSLADKETHAKELAELQRGFEETKSKFQAELEASQASKAADADAEHGKAIEELLTLQESKISGLREQLESSNKAKLEELQKSHDVVLANVNEQLAKANAAAQDTSALDSLKVTIAELEHKLANAVEAHAAVQESAATASRELQEKHISELSRIQAEHAALSDKHHATVAQVEELQRSATAAASGSQSQLESIQKELALSQQEITSLKEKHTATCQELEETRVYNKTMEEKLAAGEQDFHDQIDKNMQLLNQLGEVDNNISASRKRVRELEAELAALKADNDKSVTSGLEASQWASADEGTDGAVVKGPAAAEGEDLGSSIEGTVGNPRLESYSSELPDFHPFT